MTQFITQPEEPLIGTIGIHETAERLQQFLTHTGLQPDDVALSKYTTIPLPIYPETWPPGKRRWDGLNPEALTLPIFWLPPRLAGRYTDTDGNPETIDEWAVRVCLELTAADLYDDTTGQWQDILANHGLNITNPDHLHRVQEWLGGQPDDILDSIDLTEAVTPQAENPDEQEQANAWAYHVTQDLLWADYEKRIPGKLPAIAWTVLCRSIADWAQVLTETADLTIEQLTSEVEKLLAAADTQLEDMDEYRPYRAQWGQLIDTWDGFEDSLRNIILPKIVQGLRERETFWASTLETSQ